MANFGPSILEAQVNPNGMRVDITPFDNTKPKNGARNELGAKYYDVPAISVANPYGVPAAFRYVLYKSTANAAVQTTPAIVWWTDATFTTVTSTKSEGLGGATGAPSFPAGFLMLNSTDLSALTATILNNAGNGSFCWIQVFGYLKSVTSPAAAAGDQLMATQTDWTTTGGMSKVAVSVAPTGRVVGYAVGASASDVWVSVEGA